MLKLEEDRTSLDTFSRKKKTITNFTSVNSSRKEKALLSHLKVPRATSLHLNALKVLHTALAQEAGVTPEELEVNRAPEVNQADHMRPLSRQSAGIVLGQKRKLSLQDDVIRLRRGQRERAIVRMLVHLLHFHETSIIAKLGGTIDQKNHVGNSSCFPFHSK